MSILSSQEEHCRNAVHKWLLKEGYKCFSWTPERNDPPDVWLRYFLKYYAVEITRVEGSTPEGMPGSTAANSLLAVGEDISAAVIKEINAKGISLAHNYRLHLAPHGGHKISKKKIVRYFGTAISKHYYGYLHGNYKPTDRILDIYDANDSLTGIKFGLTGPCKTETEDEIPSIEVSASPYGMLPDMGIGQTPGLLKNSIEKKITKLKNNNRAKPWVLVLEDGYGFDYDPWAEQLPAKSTEFDAIFRIDGDRASLIYGKLKIDWSLGTLIDFLKKQMGTLGT